MRQTADGYQAADATPAPPVAGPGGTGRVVPVIRELARWSRRAADGTRHRVRHTVRKLARVWSRSLQLRVIGTTVVISVAVVAVIGYFFVQQIASGLLASQRSQALNQVAGGLVIAQNQPDMLSPGPTSTRDLFSLAGELQAGSGPGNLFYVAIKPQTSAPTLEVTGDQAVDLPIPSALIKSVTKEQKNGKNNRLWSTQTTLVTPDGKTRVPALAVGVPISPYDQLYYFFPLTAQVQTLRLVETTAFGAGAGAIVLLVVIVSLVTRWVLVPIRQAAQAASRLSDGNLGERMPARGTDDLAALARSFNDMAASLQDKLAELEELSQVQRQFVSDVSHELRTPLTTIRIAADVLFERRSQLEPGATRSAELLQSQLERFEALLADLLEISRHDANVATLDAEPADVCDLVLRAAADAEQLAARRGTRIEFRLPPEPCIAEVDRRRVERVLRNLLGNAVEHGEGRDVVVTVAADTDAVAVAVRDYGVGLAVGEHQFVFDRFWRADPARARTTGGTGLGLAIALEDARLHGGWLQAWGERGKGTVFRLTLPRSVGHQFAGSPLPLEPDNVEVALPAAAAPQMLSSPMPCLPAPGAAVPGAPVPGGPPVPTALRGDGPQAEGGAGA